MAINVENLKKLPDEPAARLLARANTKLQTELDLPAVAGVGEVLKALDEKGASFDILNLLAASLPRREAVWWACLAAMDIAGEEDENATPSIQAAKAWVYKPDADNRAEAATAMEAADNDDDTVYCAMAAYYGDGTAGPGDQAEHPAPPSSVSAAVVIQNSLAISALDLPPDDALDLLIRRGLDIARGGNGSVERPAVTEKTEDE